MGVPQAFEHLGTGGIAGFGLFLGRQAEILKQRDGELFRGIEIERIPHRFRDPLLDRGDPVFEQGAEIRDALAVHLEAEHLHIREDPCQRNFHLPQQIPHLPLSELLLEAVGHRGQNGRFGRNPLRRGRGHLIFLGEPGQLIPRLSR